MTLDETAEFCLMLLEAEQKRLHGIYTPLVEAVQKMMDWAADDEAGLCGPDGWAKRREAMWAALAAVKDAGDA
jgi:hypothetical protein